jgi:hypothetical protein
VKEVEVGDLVKLHAWVHKGQIAIVVGFTDGEESGVRVLLSDGTTRIVHVRNVWKV